MRPDSNRSLFAAALLSMAALARPALAGEPAVGFFEDPGFVAGARVVPDDVPVTPLAPEGRAAAAKAPSFRVPDLSFLVAEPVRGVASSGFGWRDDPIEHYRKFHKGADYRADRGTPVYASAGGVVSYCGRMGGYGKIVELRHPGGVRTRYAHLARIHVRCGEEVRADAPIGAVGSTGRATGPHLHFEVRIDGRPVDPNTAVRVGMLQRSNSLDELELASLRLAPEVQANVVSPFDPPRAKRTKATARDDDRKRRRRARNS